MLILSISVKAPNNIGFLVEESFPPCGLEQNLIKILPIISCWYSVPSASNFNFLSCELFMDLDKKLLQAERSKSDIK